MLKVKGWEFFKEHKTLKHRKVYHINHGSSHLMLPLIVFFHFCGPPHWMLSRISEAGQSWKLLPSTLWLFFGTIWYSGDWPVLLASEHVRKRFHQAWELFLIKKYKGFLFHKSSVSPLLPIGYVEKAFFLQTSKRC